MVVVDTPLRWQAGLAMDLIKWSNAQPAVMLRSFLEYRSLLSPFSKYFLYIFSVASTSTFHRIKPRIKPLESKHKCCAKA